jgi:hypothetical protein
MRARAQFPNIAELVERRDFIKTTIIEINAYGEGISAIWRTAQDECYS